MRADFREHCRAVPEHIGGLRVGTETDRGLTVTEETPRLRRESLVSPVMKIEYTIETIIDRPRDFVVALFDNQECLKEWLTELESMDPLEGEPGTAGAKSKMVFDQKGRKMEMIETILERSPPERFRFTYECGKVWNEVDNRFEETEDGQKTLWKAHNVFVLGGFMKIIGFFMKGAFPKQSQVHIDRFKAYVESRDSAPQS